MLPIYCVDVHDMKFLMKLCKNKDMLQTLAVLNLYHDYNEHNFIIALYSIDSSREEIQMCKIVDLIGVGDENSVRTVHINLNTEVIRWFSVRDFIERQSVKVYDKTYDIVRLNDRTFYFKYYGNEKLLKLKEVIFKNLEWIDEVFKNEWIPENVLFGSEF